MIDSNRQLFKWGPIDGRLIYVEPFVRAFKEFPSYIEGSWPDSIGYFKDDKVVFVLDDTILRDRGEHLFTKYTLDEVRLKEEFEAWWNIVEKLKDIEKKVNQDLSKYSDQELLQLFKQWDKIHIDFWLTGLLPELSNWGGERILKNKILEFDKLHFIEIFETLSAPEDFSFFQVEELDFMKLKLGEGSLEKHQKKYYWLRNSYGFTKVLDVDYFKDELDKISTEEAKDKIDEIKNYVKKIKDKKNELIQKYNIDKETQNISSKLAYCIWWQDYRKQFIFIANHIITIFLQELSSRKKVDFKELCYYTTPEIIELFDDKIIEAKSRFNGFLMYWHEYDEIEFMEGDLANEFIKPYIELEIDVNQKEIKGLVVSKGSLIKGKVRIILTPRNMEFEDGDILVAPMTSPDFIVAMRKASAIITDEGGMTCHAAIVSRELGIPCIVATRIATKLLKEGDLVEVDAENGVVRKL